MALSLTVPAANGNGASADVEAGRHLVSIFGTFDSGTVALQGSDDDTNFFPICNLGGATAVTFTADGSALVEIPEGLKLRAALSGSSGSTSCTMKLRKTFTPTKLY